MSVKSENIQVILKERIGKTNSMNHNKIEHKTGFELAKEALKNKKALAAFKTMLDINN